MPYTHKKDDDVSARQVEPYNPHRRHQKHARFVAPGVLEALYGRAALRLCLVTVEELEVDPEVIEQLQIISA